MSTTTQAKRPLADKIECAQFIGIKKRTLEKYVSLGKIPFIRLSQKVVRFDLDDVSAALRKQAR